MTRFVSTRFLPRLVAVPVALAAAACGDVTEPRPAAEVEVVLERDTAFALEERVPVEAVVRDEAGVPIDGARVGWSSSREDVAVLDPEDAVVVARAPGSTTVAAHVGGVSDEREFVVEQRPAAVEAVEGQAQEGVVDEPLADSLVARVVDAGGHPVPDSPVLFRVTGGGGTVEPDSTSADGDGLASARWILGPGSRDHHRVTAESGGRTVVFEAEATPRLAALLVPAGGDNQEGRASELLPGELVVRVSDDLDNPVEGIELAFEVEVGDGAVDPARTTTDADGVARTRWTLGPVVGTQEVRARLDDPGEGSGPSPVPFSALATRNDVVEGVVAPVDGFPSAQALESAPLVVAASDAVVDGPTAPSGPAAPGRSTGSGGPADAAPPDELLVTFQPRAMGLERAREAWGMELEEARDSGGRLRDVLRRSDAIPGMEVVGVSPALRTARVRLPPGTDLEQARRTLESVSGVARVEPNHLFLEGGRGVRRARAEVRWAGTALRPAAARPDPLPPAGAGPDDDPGPAWATWEVRPDDPYFPYQAWHLGVAGMPRAWELTTGSSQVLVAVLDDGIRFEHPDLAGALTDDGRAFVSEGTIPHCDGGEVSRSGGGSGYGPDPTVPERFRWVSHAQCAQGPVPVGGHGLHVAGIIGARTDDGYGTAGVSWSARVRPVRVLDTAGRGTLYDVAQGVLYAAGLPADDGQGGAVQAPEGARIINLSFSGSDLGETLREALEAAAGTGALLVAAAGNTGSEEGRYPAAHPQVLSVTAVDPGLERASYATYGPTVDLAAPGGVVAVDRPGEGVYSLAWNFELGEPAHLWRDGTSMAAAHVAGAAALLLTREPGLEGPGLRGRLVQHARPMAEAGVGTGLLDAYASLLGGAVPSSRIEVRLYDAATGAVKRRVETGGDGAFRFRDLPDGRYYVYAGEDRGGDGRFGVPGRRWGAAGGAGRPREIVVDGTRSVDGSLEMGHPRAQGDGGEGEPPVLVPGGYLFGVLGEGEEERLRIPVPEPGTYRLETGPWYGACGLAREANTRLELLDPGGGVVEENEDADPDALDFCSRIEVFLEAGTYELSVGVGAPGTYTVRMEPER